MRELRTYRGHSREVTSLSWHPFHEDLFVSGGHDGSILFWLAGQDEPVGQLVKAHDNSVWDLAWHPVGHILVSGSNDHTIKFWCRQRPGEDISDSKYLKPLLYQKDEEEDENMNIEPGFVGVEASTPIPGLGMIGKFDQTPMNEDHRYREVRYNQPDYNRREYY